MPLRVELQNTDKKLNHRVPLRFTERASDNQKSLCESPRICVAEFRLSAPSVQLVVHFFDG